MRSFVSGFCDKRGAVATFAPSDEATTAASEATHIGLVTCATRSDRTASQAVAFENVSFSFDDHAVLRDISSAVPKGSMAILLGPSGAGKSVILKLILGLLRPDAGRISVHGERVEVM